MTAVAGIITEGRVHFASDTLMTAGNSVARDVVGKIWTDGDKIIGYAGAAKFIAILRYGFEFPLFLSEVYSEEAYMTYLVPQTLREFLIEKGLAVETDTGHVFDGELMIGWHGKIWRICSDFYCGQASDNFAAIGSGADYAGGALFVLTHTDLTPKEQLEAALETAANFKSDVGGSFDFLSEPR